MYLKRKIKGIKKAELESKKRPTNVQASGWILHPKSDMKILYFLAVLCISTVVVVAKDIELQTSTTPKVLLSSIAIQIQQNSMPETGQTT